jgi:hypothetical protein
MSRNLGRQEKLKQAFDRTITDHYDVYKRLAEVEKKETQAVVDPFELKVDDQNENVEQQTTSSTQDLIRQVCDEVKEMLVAKNIAYGDSALNPVRVFSRCSPEEQLRVRIDDKLSRLARGSAAGEDVVNDLIGYLVLLKVHMLREKL